MAVKTMNRDKWWYSGMEIKAFYIWDINE